MNVISSQVKNLFAISAWVPEEYLGLVGKSVVYALLCRHGKVYCGYSDDVFKRFEKHLNGSGSMWTKVYRPIRILEIKEIGDSRLMYEEERGMTISMMRKYGIENVRGGEYSRFQLNQDQVESLRSAIVERYGLCYNCLEDFDHHRRNGIWFGAKCSSERCERFDWCERCSEIGHHVFSCPVPVVRKRKREVTLLPPMKLRNRSVNRFRVRVRTTEDVIYEN